MEDLSGILPIDKPVGMTSHDVVDVIRRLYGTKRVGHTGTLDPAASGLLLIVVGRATRIAPYLSAHDKTYLAGIVFGSTSNSGDSDGAITATGQPIPDEEHLRQLISEFVGEIELPVPELASVRSGGRRRYELARAGKDVPEMTRKSTIHSIDVVSFVSPRIDILVRCASGTYIRSLAEAIGERAGCGAYLGALRRETVGNARVEGAYGLDYLAARHALGQELPSPEAVDDYLELPVIEVAADADTVIHHGQQLIPAMVKRVIGEFAAGTSVAISVEGFGVVAIGKSLIDSAGIRAGSDVTSPSQNILSYQCVLI
jgi:tRNA pseudouridine55 synthase